MVDTENLTTPMLAICLVTIHETSIFEQTDMIFSALLILIHHPYSIFYIFSSKNRSKFKNNRLNTYITSDYIYQNDIV